MNNKYDNLWCLRDGDLNPEPLSTILREYGYNPKFIDELRGQGLLFTSKHDALKASVVAKRAILNMSRKRHESNHKQVHTHESLLHQVRESASHQHQYSNSLLRKQQHNRQIFCGHKGVSNLENHSKIEITIHL